MTAAAVVDHVEAHQGDNERFWNPDNWQSLCKRHHDSAKQRQEKKQREGVGAQKVCVVSLGTGALGNLLRPRNSTGGRMTSGDWPADKVERWPLDRLVPYAKNARTHDDKQVAQIAASIREWGWTTSVLVDEKGMIIAGHGRVLAARQLGLLEAPVMVARAVGARRSAGLTCSPTTSWQRMRDGTNKSSCSRSPTSMRWDSISR